MPILLKHSALHELYEKKHIIPSSGGLLYFKEVLKFYFWKTRWELITQSFHFKFKKLKTRLIWSFPILRNAVLRTVPWWVLHSTLQEAFITYFTYFGVRLAGRYKSHISLTFPAPMTFSAAYTESPHREHFSAPPNFWANFEVFGFVVGRWGESVLKKDILFL